METVTRKSEIKTYLDPCIAAYTTKGVAACVQELADQILSKKVKFPLLEFCAHSLYKTIAPEEQLAFCDAVESLKTEGGNVILGIMLQNRLPDHFEQSLQQATAYITRAHVWYVCDIMGERVYGYSLLTQPERTIPHIRQLSRHPIHWVVRAVGAGVHYAIKKGLDRSHVQSVFSILLASANAKNKEIRAGIGWAAKTTATFHPDIIEHFRNQIQDPASAANWFRKKVDIGLKRYQYAKGN